MCGHFGYITNTPKTDYLKRKKFFSQMVIFDTIRGDDSTGVYLLNHNEEEYLHKRALDGYDFSRLHHIRNKFIRYDCSVAMGHNRAATKGSISDDNAHPFTHGDIVMTHNGTLHNFAVLPEANKFQVDSEWVCYAIDTMGIDTVASKATGAFALAYYDKAQKKFYLITNGERELSFAFSKNGDTMYYASEGPMLSAACYRNDINLKNKEWHSCEKGILYEFPIDNPTEYATRELELYKYVPPVYSHNKKCTGGTQLKKQTFVAMLDSIGLHSNQTLSLAYLDSKVTDLSIELLIVDPENVYAKCHNLVTKYIAKNEGEFWELLTDADMLYKGNIQAGLMHKDTGVSTIYLRSMEVTKKDLPEGLYEDVPFPDMVQGPSGVYIPIAEFNILVADGCWQCGGTVDEAEAEGITWTSNSSEPKISQPVCATCTKEWDDYASQI